MVWRLLDASRARLGAGLLLWCCSACGEPASRAGQDAPASSDPSTQHSEALPVLGPGGASAELDVAGASSIEDASCISYGLFPAEAGGPAVVTSECRLPLLPAPPLPDRGELIVEERGEEWVVPRELGSGRGGWAVDAAHGALELHGVVCDAFVQDRFEAIFLLYCNAHTHPEWPG